MTSIELTGKTIEEATELALEQLGVTEDDVDVEILDEGSRGFLGLGQTPAKVRVSVKSAAAPRPKSKSKTKVETEPSSEPVCEVAVQTESTASPGETEEKIVSDEILSQVSETSLDVLQHMLDGIGAGGTAVAKSTTDERIDIEIQNADAAIIIGKHGQTIDAMQYLVNVIANRPDRTRIRVNLDAEGYRSRREEALRNQALFLADKVKQSGQEAVLESLHANERRIIHTTLAEDPDVYTYSEGQEPDRHVVISPKK